MTEQVLIQGCINDDSPSQKILYQQYLPYVYGICRRFRLNDEGIKDLVQDIFIEVFFSLKKFDPQKGALKFWIKGITVNCILKQLRKQKNIFYDWEEISEEPYEWDVEIQHLEAEYLIAMIRELPEGYRTIFNLAVVDGYSHKEIGDMLGINESSSRSQLSRAKKLLQEKLITVKK